MVDRRLSALDDRRLASLLRRQDGVVTTRQLLAAGLRDTDIRRLVRRGRLLRLRRGAYLAHPEREVVREWRVHARAASLTVPDVVIAGATAARLWGLDGVTGGPVEVVVPPTRSLRARRDLLPHARALVAEDVELLDGLAVTTPARTLADVVPTLDRPTALAVLDSALRRRLVGAAGLVEIGARVAGRPGSAHVADLWALADGRAESVLESRVRLRCLDGGLVPDDLQVEIRDDDGMVLARADMGFRTRSRPGRGWLLVEADGAAVHSGPEAVHVDRVRGNRLTARGCDMVRFTWRDTVDPLSIPRTVRAAI